MLRRSLGLRTDVDVDVFQSDVAAGDLFLLCSDGLTGMVWEDDLRVILAQTEELDVVARKLIDAANARGGNDNITVVLVRVD